MNERFRKQVPIKLATPDYEALRQRVLRRDGWRCQFCGSRTNLEVHHQHFRSHPAKIGKTISLPYARVATRRYMAKYEYSSDVRIALALVARVRLYWGHVWRLRCSIPRIMFYYTGTAPQEIS